MGSEFSHQSVSVFLFLVVSSQFSRGVLMNFLHFNCSSVFPHLPVINVIGLDPNVLAPGGMYDYKHAVYKKKKTEAGHACDKSKIRRVKSEDLTGGTEE